MFGALVIILVIIIGIILKYQVEGEKNVPFYLAEMNVISTAEGVGNQEATEMRWNMNIFQNNDIYLKIAKNEIIKKQKKSKRLRLKIYKSLKHLKKERFKHICRIVQREGHFPMMSNIFFKIN